jgi:hypothetical protein
VSVHDPSYLALFAIPLCLGADRSSDRFAELARKFETAVVEQADRPGK